MEPGRQRRLDLDTGLEHPYAENVLRAMDADGKVGLKHAPAALLAKARERTLGYPRALEHLFGILSADRDTSLQEILDDTRQLLPEQVVAVLVGEAFSRLDLTAQRVMQALATYRYPVPPAAVDYLLQSHIPGVESGPVLRRLVNMQFARRDAGRYYIHQVDRDYALSRLVEGAPADREVEMPPLTRFALRHRAAEWFKLSRKPREAWNTLDDLAAQLSEFELRCEGDDYETAAALLLEFDFDYLFLWGQYRLMTELHERLQGKISDPGLAASSVGNLGSAYYRMGQLQRARGCYEQALHLAQEHNDRWGEGTWLGNLGACIADLGQHARAIEYYEQALGIAREVGDRRGESADLGNLSIQYAEIGEVARAIEYCQQALAIDREIGDRAVRSPRSMRTRQPPRGSRSFGRRVGLSTRMRSPSRATSALALSRRMRMPSMGTCTLPRATGKRRRGSSNRRSTSPTTSGTLIGRKLHGRRLPWSTSTGGTSWGRGTWRRRPGNTISR